MSRHQVPGIRTATLDETDLIADIIADAFCTLEQARWLVTDPLVRPRILRAQFRIMVAHLIGVGHADLMNDYSAVAVWGHNTGSVPAGEPADYDRRLAEACGAFTQRFRVFDAMLHANQPTMAHHHLAFLAVLPSFQNTGRGSALLRHHHAQLDVGGIDAYLEASSARSRELYARHGYRPGKPFWLPDGPPLWPMVRQPVANSCCALSRSTER